ncbi:hypothetical protein CAP39_13765 [Sphingomonas sp. IBVSS1]|nr:hypothetical protein CAP39_13765 [Sphingomonas sp. IBVSS1]
MAVERLSSPARFEAWFARLLAGDAVPLAPGLARAVAVHANNAMAAATAALASNFPVLLALMGEAAFADLAQRHARRCPPADPRLCLYGRGLDETLVQALPAGDWPWLPDMARLEQVVVGALFAADPPRRPRRLDPARCWPLAPATGWVWSAAPIASLWQAHQPGAAWPDEFPAAGELALISRRDGQCLVTALPAAALPLLEALKRRTPLAQLPADGLPHLPAIAAAGALVPAVGDG